MNVHGIHDPPPPNSQRRLNSPGRFQGGPINNPNAPVAPNPQANNFRNQNPPQNQQNGLPWGGFNPPLTQEHLAYAQQNKVILISGQQQLKNPRDENYWDMLRSSFCPSWKCLSWAMLVILADIGMFIAQCVYGIDKDGELLEVSTSSLLKMGAVYGPKIRDGEVWRLLSAIFVHLNLIHLIGNIFSTFILVTRIEHTLGFVKIAIVYLLAGIAGNIFSLAVDSDFRTIKGGASTSLFGMIGLILGYIIINWRGLRLVGNALRCSILCMFFFLLLFVLLFTPTSSGQVDHLGHLGGFLAGIWLSAIKKPLINQTREKIIRGVFVVFLVGMLTGCFLGFYLKRNDQ